MDENVPVLDPEDAMAIFEWAHTAAAAVVLMFNHPNHSNTREALEELSNMKRTIESMHNDIPEVLYDHAADLAEKIIEGVNKEEVVVDDFMEDVEKFSNGS